MEIFYFLFGCILALGQSLSLKAFLSIKNISSDSKTNELAHFYMGLGHFFMIGCCMVFVVIVFIFKDLVTAGLALLFSFVESFTLFFIFDYIYKRQSKLFKDGKEAYLKNLDYK